jgi:hypothetical protein
MKKRSVVELLVMTENLKDNYNSDAIKAAEIELKLRKLTDSDLTDARSIIDGKKQKQIEKKELINKLKKLFHRIDFLIDPIKKKDTDGIIKIIVISLSILYLNRLIKNRGLTIFMLQEPHERDVWFFFGLVSIFICVLPFCY